MNIKSRQLIGLLVETKSGRDLGRLKEIDIDTDSGRVVSYIVSPSQILSKIFKDDLRIDKSQIIEITKSNIIVEDATVADKELTEEFA